MLPEHQKQPETRNARTSTSDRDGYLILDNSFFRDVVAGDAHVSDYQFLLDHPATAEWVRRYAADERGWREAFGAALTTISVLGQESLIQAGKWRTIQPKPQSSQSQSHSHSQPTGSFIPDSTSNGDGGRAGTSPTTKSGPGGR